ncbi:sulfurtransferase [Nocardia miyunensis]|uniref:sulfurtransferase n=1 Tax=Nocardia miyunensis TaxID=282684 RepID=UPI00082E982E|nr:rhodanese-like domain-containing protein [Nocardia miyunensis]
MSDERSAHLVSADDLIGAPPPDLVLLDVRIGPDGRADRDRYRRGHLPGAHFADLDEDLAGPVTGRSGARPLPEAADLTSAFHRWGITSRSSVVVYDDSSSTAAARAWWVLRWAGLADVRLLDGGLSAWVSGGGVLSAGDPAPGDGDVIALPGSLPTVDIDQITPVAQRGALLDARAVPDYLGRNGSIGHIPGAVSAPVHDDLTAEGRLRDHARLVDRYREFGVFDTGSPVACYCGSGVAAALQVLVLATLGVDAALYPGSLSQWAADPARLVIRDSLAAPRDSVTVAADESGSRSTGRNA